MKKDQGIKGRVRRMNMFQDRGRSARIELAVMAKQLGMKFIGYNPTAQQVSLEYKGKGLTYPVEEFVTEYQKASKCVDA